MQYSNELWFESENEYFTFLEDKIIINTISDDNLSKFKEAVKPVWQHYIDHEYFTWDDVDTVLSIINTD
jgi:TRAP-type C4-dicarboxylate transport system substrate-binding protein